MTALARTVTKAQVERAVELAFDNPDLPRRKPVPRTPITAQERASVVNLWHSGHLPKEIAWKVGRPDVSVRRIIRKAIGDDARFKTVRNTRIAEMWRSGSTGSEIGAALSMSTTAVYHMIDCMRRRGEELPRRR